MIHINPKKFYNDVVESNRPIDEIFNYLAATMNSVDFDELLEEFSNQLNENYDNVTSEIKPVQDFKTLNPIKYRVRLTKMLLSVCALGASFDKTVFNFPYIEALKDNSFVYQNLAKVLLFSGYVTNILTQDKKILDILQPGYAMRLNGNISFYKNTFSKIDIHKLNEEEIQFYIENNCSTKYIKCPKGYGVFWDSRTVHYGNPVEKVDNFNYRCVVYVCMVPRNFATKKQLEKRKLAFVNGRMTTHYPHKVKLFPKNPQTYGKPILNIKDFEVDMNDVELALI